jgi:predicted NBD/HSP70 family sugar kinase
MDVESTPRAELAEMTQLSRAAVNQALNTLIKLDIVEEAGLGESTGGRRPQMVRLSGTAAYTLGAAMSDWEWTMTLTDLWGHPVAEERERMIDRTPEAAIEALARAHARIAPAMAHRRVPAVLGVGAPGLIDVRTGFIHSSVNLGWNRVPFAEMIRERLGLEAIVVNRSKTSALAESWFSPEGRTRNLIYIHLGLGVPAGLVLNGELITGNHSFAGELGHFTIVPDGPPCPCGNRGCLQELISEDAVSHRATTMAFRDDPGHAELTAEYVLREADKGNEVFRHVVRETAGYLAVAVGNLINLLDPDRIVLGGPMVEWSALLVEETRRQVAYRAMRLPLEVARIEAATLGTEAGAVGAALMIRSRAMEMILA